MLRILLFALGASLLPLSSIAAMPTAATAPAVVVTPASRRPLDEVTRDCSATLAQLTPELDLDLPKFRDLFSRLWTFVGEWTVAYLDEHPNASADELVAALTDAEPLQVTAMQLTTRAGRAYVMAPSFWGVATLLIVARNEAGQFRVAWTIADAKSGDPARAKEFGYWTELNPMPITGTVHALPSTRTGDARFFVDAVTTVDAGCFWPFQISIWQWDGYHATPLLIETYGRTFDTPPNELHGAILTVHTKQMTKVLSTAGCDIRPQGVWRIKITPDAIEDERPVFVDPYFGLLDTLFDGILRGRDVSDIASPSVSRVLKKALSPFTERVCEINLRVKHDRTRDLVDAASDQCGDFTFWIETRHGKPFVAKAVRGSFYGVLR